MKNISNIICLLLSLVVINNIKAEDVAVDFGEIDESAPIYYNVPQYLPQHRTKSLNTSCIVGEIEMSESTTSAGGKVYSVPILVSSESRFKPEIALVYNSQTTSGICGYGWNIQNISSINVVNKCQYYDGMYSAPDLSNVDICVFALDGVRLLPSLNDSDNCSMETASGYIRVEKVVSGNNIAYFKVRYPDGKTAQFGFQDNKVTTYTYPITEITDSDGYKIFYEYVNSGGTFYISKIAYGGKTKEDCYGHIYFTYSDILEFPKKYISGQEIYSDKILKRISSNVILNGEEKELRHYNFEHSGKDNQLLTKITSGIDSFELNPITFDYGYDTDVDPELKLVAEKTVYHSPVELSNHKLNYVRGKFLVGKYSDGMLIYPEFTSYSYNYRSSMSADQDILISTGLSTDGKTFSIKADEGLRTIGVFDVDRDCADEVVKINTITGSTKNKTKVIITIYGIDILGKTLETEFVHQYEIENVVAIEDMTYPIPMMFLFGQFEGNMEWQILAVAYKDENQPVAFADYVHLGNLFSVKRISAPEEVCDHQNVGVCNADFNGDGQDELCLSKENELKLYKIDEWAGFTNLQSNYESKLTDEYSSNILLCDINADGKMDMISQPKSSKFVTMRHLVPLWAPDTCPSCGFYAPIRDTYSKKCMNCQYDIYEHLYKTRYVFCILCGGHMVPTNYPDINGFSCSVHGSTPNAKEFVTELSVPEKWLALVSDGKGFRVSEFEIDRWDSGKTYMMDIDGDSYPDLVTDIFGEIYVRKNKNGVFQEKQELLHYYDNQQILPFNVHSRGLSHFVTVTKGGKAKCYKYGVDESKRHLITSSNNSLGLSAYNVYENLINTSQPISDWNNNGNHRMLLCVPLQLLKQSTIYNSKNEKVADVNYKYSLPSVDTRGLGFRGFSKIETIDEVNDETTITDYFDIEEVSQIDSRDVKKNFSYVTVGRSKFQNRRIQSQIEMNKRTNQKTHRTYTYDEYGNPLIEELSYEGSNMECLVTNEYINIENDERYHVGLPQSRVTQKIRDGQSWFDKTVFIYDNVGRPLSQIIYTGSSGNIKKEETRWSYDSYGNVLSEKVTPYDSGIFTGTTYAYDASGRYLLNVTDPMGLSVSYSDYDRFGNPNIETNHRGQKTYRDYDPLGRCIKVSSPTVGLEESKSIVWDDNAIYRIQIKQTGKPDMFVTYDEFGRELLSGSIRIDGQWQKKEKKYNKQGWLLAESIPYIGDSAKYWNEYEYDKYGRVSKVVNAFGKETSWTYDNLRTVQHSNGITRSTRLDASGLLVESTDPGGTIVYRYRPDGQISLMIAPNEIYTVFRYDDAGRRIAVEDPSAGVRSTEYKYENGQLRIKEIDGDNRVITTLYDPYGKPVEVERPEFNTSYKYNVEGQLVKIVSTNGTSREIQYDQYGRILMDTEFAPDGKYLTKEYYFIDGVLGGIIYYNNSFYHNIKYGYKNGIKVSAIADDIYPIWELLSVNEEGKPSKVSTGGIIREYGYTPDGFPTFRKFGKHQHFMYEFDVVTDNLLSRTDVIRGISEQFDYDDINRLINENGRESVYDDNGNLLSRDNVGTMEYNMSPYPYRLKKFTPSGSFDHSMSHLSVSYTSFSRPDTIKNSPLVYIESRKNAIDVPPVSIKGMELVSFVYNDSGDRVKMSLVAAPGQKEKSIYYLGNVYECDEITGMERMYLEGDAYTAPVVSIKKDGKRSFYFIGRDYLGSITHITNSKDSLIAEYSYDAWGQLRNPDTQQPYEDVPELLLRRGFTGHEWLPWFNLYNMNARLYDPVLGRFMSPDPYVQMPDFTQNLNRYLYALNNPFSYRDPNGEFFLAAYISFFKGLFQGKNPFKAAWKAIKNEAKIIAGLFITDKNATFSGKMRQLVGRFTWELPQTLFGLSYSIMRNSFGIVDEVYHYRGATFSIRETVSAGDGITLGSFINIKTNQPIPKNEDGDFDPTLDINQLYMHEYGHYLQSQIFGPIYLPAFGIPSISSVIFNRRMHKFFWAEKDASTKAKSYFEAFENLEDWNEKRDPVFRNGRKYMLYGFDEQFFSDFII